MMLTGVHFLLTYACPYECDHCFLYCGPHTEGTFTLDQIRRVLGESRKLGTVKSIYYEGGEPFLFYPVLLEAVRLARESGFSVGLVSNSYWATAVEDARHWLRPLAQLSVDDLSISDDAFHGSEDDESPAKIGLRAAEQVGFPRHSICIEKPVVQEGRTGVGEKGEPVVGGGAMFRGRAADKLTDGLPRRSPSRMNTCPHEELRTPGRVHVDSFGHVHMCQGISMGNLWETPLAELVTRYDADTHPIAGPLLRGGPQALAEEYGVQTADGYVDECHMCFEVRRALLDRFPQYLAPQQVYGVE